MAATLVIGIMLFGAAAYLLFTQQQERQLSSLVERDLERISALVRDPVVGAPLFRGGGADFVEQFVARNGAVVLPMGSEEPIPLYTSPTLEVEGGRARMISSVPWQTSSGSVLGTIRLALDVSDAMSARRTLSGILLASGAAIAVIVAIGSFVVLRRALRPLRHLAAQARSIDPARPEMARYRGPQDEVADVAVALNSALDKIRERRDAERASLAEVAHELAAPLSVVAGQFASLTRRYPEDSRLLAAHDAARELLYTSQDLLTLARGELERPLDLEIVDLSKVLEQIEREYPGIEVVVSGQAEVAGNVARLRQLMRNLVRNAVQATGGTQGITVRLDRVQDSVVVDVRDDGPGISQEDMPHLFERFYSRRGGTGVGLSVVKGIVEQHEGTIAVHSVDGEGTRFTVELPSLDARLEPPA